MPLSIRLDPGLASRIDEYCRRIKVSKSYVVQRGLIDYLDIHALPTLHDLGKDLFPAAGRGGRDASEARVKRYREYLRSKRARRERTSNLLR